MTYLKFILLAALCFITTGCMAAKQNVTTDTASMEWRIKSLEESFLNFREEQRQQADANAESTAMLDKKIAELEQQVAASRAGQPVMNESESIKMEAELKPEEDGWVEGQKDSSTVVQNPPEKPWDNVPGAPIVVPEPTVVKRETVRTPPKPSVASSSKRLYDAALGKYNHDDYTGSRRLFDEFIKKYPKDSLLPNVLYWKGETFYSEKNYAQAILAFKEVTGRFPKHDKAAAALLKIGMSYDKVDDPDNSVFYLRALVEDFPQSAPAQLARKELKRLGG